MKIIPYATSQWTLSHTWDDWQGLPKEGFEPYKLYYSTYTITKDDGTSVKAQTAVDSFTTDEWLTTAGAIGDTTLSTSHTKATAVNFVSGMRVRLGRAGLDLSQCEDVTLAGVAYTTGATYDTGAHTLERELDKAHVITSTLLSPLTVFASAQDFSNTTTYPAGTRLVVLWKHWGTLVATTYSDLLQEHVDVYEIEHGTQDFSDIWGQFGEIFPNVRETCRNREQVVQAQAKDLLRAKFALFKRDLDRLRDPDITVRPMLFAMALTATEDAGMEWTDKRVEWMALFNDAVEMIGKSPEWWDEDQDLIEDDEEIAAPISDWFFVRGF